MAKPCRILFFSFIDNKIYDGFNEYDLVNGIEYCEWLISEGYELEPHDEFNLSEFIIWAKSLINKEMFRDETGKLIQSDVPINNQ